MKKRLSYLALPVITLILEILPYGAVCNFYTPDEGKIRRTFSYFSLTPYGYANFAPLLCALVTLPVIVTLLIFAFNADKRVIHVTKILLVLDVLLSLCPLIFGISMFSIVGALISLTLIAELVFVFLRDGK